MFRELTCLMGALMAVAALSGCSQRPGRVAPTDIDPEEVAQALIAEHDKDGNGTLSAEELRTVAAIQTCQDDYDRNGDSQISPVELTENFQRIFDGKVGLITASCRVTRNGRPLPDALVYFVPISVFADVLPVAGGITGRNGVTDLSIRQDDLPKNAPKVQGLIRPGLYFVEVTHPSMQIPVKYNKQTELGYEVTPRTVAGGPLNIALKF